MSFSIAGYDPETGQMGVALASSSTAGPTAGGALFVRAGAGAVACLATSDPALGETLLDDIAAGSGGPEALAACAVLTAARDDQLIAVLDAAGQGAFYTGSNVPGRCAGAVGANCVALGHGLANDAVVRASVAGFEGTEGPLAGRLIAALDAGLEAGGLDETLVSAGVRLAGANGGSGMDLQIDQSDDPILDLAKALAARASGDGVPGDE